MTIEASLIQYLLLQPTVTTDVAQRIYADLAPQDAVRPFLVVSITDDTGEYHTEGHAGITESRLQVSCEGGSYQEARDLAETVRLLIDGFRGMWHESNVSMATVSRLRTTRGVPQSGDEIGKPSLTFDVEVWHQVTAPEF